MKRIAAIFLTAIFLISAAPEAGADSNVYFFSANDTLMDLTADTMPEFIGSVLYAPSEFLCNSQFKLFFANNKANQTATVYNSKYFVVFDLSKNYVYDQTGKTFNSRAIARNSKIYLPVSFICDYFGLTYSYLNTQIAPLIRVKNESAVLSDKIFIDAASSLMQLRLNEYNKTLTEQPPLPTPSSGVTTPPTKKVNVCLSFFNPTYETAVNILDALDGYGCRATFFFKSSDIAEMDDLIRRILGKGNSVGIDLSGKNDYAEIKAEIETANKLLDVITKTRTRLLSPVPDGLSSRLQNEGYLIFNTEINAVSSNLNLLQSIIEEISKSRAPVISVKIDVTDEVLKILPGLFNFIAIENYYASAVTEAQILS